MDTVKKGKIDNFKKTFNDFMGLFVFFLKSIFKSRYFYAIFIVPILIIIIIGSQLSIESAFIPVLSTCITIFVVFNYGFLYFTVKKSTLAHLFNQQYSLKTITVSFFVTIFFIGVISTFFLVAFSWFLYVNEILIIHGGVTAINADTLHREMIFEPFTTSKLGIDLYYVVFAIVLNFFVCFLFQSFFDTRKQFFFFSMSYIFLSFIFGGVFVPLYHIDPSLHPEGVHNHLSNDGKFVCYPTVQGNFEPGFVWGFSQFIPVYTLNQLNFFAFSNAYINQGTPFYLLVSAEAKYRGIEVGSSILIDVKYFSFFDPYWIYIIVAPYIWVTLLFSFGWYRTQKQEGALI